MFKQNKLLQQKFSGHIVNVASVATMAKMVLPGIDSVASKFAMLGFSEGASH